MNEEKPGLKVTVSIYIDADLKERLDDAAKRDDRPLSNYIERLLKKSFDGR